MLPFNKIPQHLQTQIEKIGKSDKFGINPETIYRNIFNSTGPHSKLAEIFEVPLQLVKEIKELSK